MKIHDIVWSEQIIEGKDVIRIIKHPAMQRIKNIWISAYGYLFDMKRNATRYDHSLGVYLLLRHFGASKEEQVAGLIHDVSHTALSHVSTYALQGKYTGTEFHELEQEKFIFESGLGSLLSDLGYNPSELLHSEKYSFLENNLPDICADRLDYALRDSLHLQILSKQQVDFVLENLKIINKEFIFKNADAAFTYSFAFYLLNLMHYGSPAEAHFNNDFGELIKYAVKKGVLHEKDWFSDDVKVINRLKVSSDKKIKKWLSSYNNKLAVYEDRKNPTKVFPKKIRIVDPKVKIGNKIKRLTEISEVYSKIINDYKKTHKEHKLPVTIFYKD
ncbi:hypothetical protein C4561_02800 [candidate division WWE3 bacterium]|jgi:HD superfamily phosphohydrolase|uniref:HD/PDEase domain-containing protein n=1 Tax=candidate division WWE3 bacterium TaxID=2053526 RepID=A0A3A4ZK02_UNCKA|nr:MAG: hypothetical protein C4561_02800 [candidate division WWE3 bacterium]